MNIYEFRESLFMCVWNDNAHMIRCRSVVRNAIVYNMRFCYSNDVILLDLQA